MRWIVVVAAALALQGSALARPTSSEWEKKVRIGRSVTVRDYTYRWTLRVTVSKYVDPARSNVGVRPRRGTRFVAFLVRLKNVGKRRYQGTPVSSTELVNAHGDVLFAPLYAEPVVAPSWVGHGWTIDPGETFQGYMSYVVPKAMKLREFRFVGTYDVATWILRR
jgi:hypothetical protein